MKNTGVIAGNFDVIPPGYIHLFNGCKEFCTELIILLHEDPSIERPEKLKPILNLDERMIILSSLKQIDQIIPYKLETDLYELLLNLDIDIRFLGYACSGRRWGCALAAISKGNPQKSLEDGVGSVPWWPLVGSMPRRLLLKEIL